MKKQAKQSSIISSSFSLTKRSVFFQMLNSSKSLIDFKWMIEAIDLNIDWSFEKQEILQYSILVFQYYDIKSIPAFITIGIN